MSSAFYDQSMPIRRSRPLRLDHAAIVETTRLVSSEPLGSFDRTTHLSNCKLSNQSAPVSFGSPDPSDHTAHINC